MKKLKIQFQSTYSVIGIILLLILLMVLNSLIKVVDVKFDMTQDKLFTLSDGTRQIINELEVPVTIRYYITEKNNTFPPHLRNYASRVEDMLEEMKGDSNGKIKLLKYNTEQDSEEEEEAELDGLVPQRFENDEPIYFGLSFTCIDNEVSIPFLFPDREEALEYEIMKRIAEVSAFEKSKLGFMTSLPVMGGEANNAGPGGGLTTFPKWFIREELEKKYQIIDISVKEPVIPEQLNALVVFHPAGITEVGEKELEKFIHRGGRLVVLLDPASLTPELLQFHGDSERSSNLPNLLKAWGVNYNPNLIVTDRQFGTNLGSEDGNAETLTVLSINSDGLNEKSKIVGSLDYVVFPFSGSMQVKPKEGLLVTPLVNSTSQSANITTEGYKPMDVSQSNLVKNTFKSRGKEQLIAVFLEGQFPSAFNTKQDLETKESKVVLFLDTDFLYDFFAIRKKKSAGETEVIPINGNMSLFMNALSSITNTDNLGNVRNRELIRRPFLKIQKMESEAREAFERRIYEVEGELRDVNNKLEDLQNRAAGMDDGLSLPPQVKYEIKDLKFRRRNLLKQLKKVRLQFRRDINLLENRIKWINIALVPILVALFGIMSSLIRKRKQARK